MMVDLDEVLLIQQAWQSAPAGDETTLQKMADTALARCAEAVAVLCDNLQQIGYPWAGLQTIPPQQVEAAVQHIQATIHLPVPPILRLFWEKVGGVSLVDLENYAHVPFWIEHKVFSPNYYCDGLHVDACGAEWTAYICDGYADWQEFEAPFTKNKYLLDLSPDGYHKDNYSGGYSYGVYAEATWKPIWQNYEWPGSYLPRSAGAFPPDFLSYLRTTILECAGFPGFLGEPGFGLIRARLLEGVPAF